MRQAPRPPCGIPGCGRNRGHKVRGPPALPTYRSSLPSAREPSAALSLRQPEEEVGGVSE